MIWGRCKIFQEIELHQQEVESKCTLFSLEYVCFRFFFFSYLYFHIKYILQEDEALEEAGGNLGSPSGCGSTLIGDHARVSQLALIPLSINCKRMAKWC